MKRNYIKIFVFLAFWTISAIFTLARANQEQLEKEMTSTQRQMYDVLSVVDKLKIVDVYDTARTKFSSSQKHGFKEYMEFIRNFIFQESNFTVKSQKSFILGIAFLDDGSYLVNTRHIQVIYGKCKSCINHNLHLMGINQYTRDTQDNQTYFDHMKVYFNSIFPRNVIPERIIRQWSRRTPISKKQMTISTPTITDDSGALDLESIVFDFNIKNPTEKKIISLTASLSRRLKEFPCFKGCLPILVCGPCTCLPTKAGCERHHLISQKLLGILGLNTYQDPTILIPHDIHVKTSSYGNTPEYHAKEIQTYEEAGCGEEGLQAVFDLGEKDLIEAAKKCGFQMNTNPSPLLNARKAIQKITINFNLS